MTTQTILLVDDEEDIRLVLGMALKDLGFEVLTAENGREGLDIFQRRRPPIVITDIKMPDIDGVNLLKKIKREDPDAEVIMITGHGDMESAIESFQSDAADFITKPIEVEALEKAMEKVRQKIIAREKLRDYTLSLEELLQKKVEMAPAEGEQAQGDGVRSVLERFQGLFEELPCPAAVMDQGLSLTAINQKFRDDFGEGLGRACYSVLKNSSAKCSQCPVERTFSSQNSQEAKIDVFPPSGPPREALVWTSPVKAAAGRVSHVLVLFIDISQIQKIHDHLASLGLMVGSLSHSIKGMLTGLDGGLYILDSGLKKDNQEQVREGLTVLKKMVGRIRNMVLDVLLFSKDRDLKKEKTSLKKFTEELHRSIQPAANQAGVELVLGAGEQDAEIEMDAGLLRTALTNVLENALEACRQGPEDDCRVELSVSVADAEIEFEIQDNGPGMDEKTRDRVCELFFSTKGSQGTGLGLFITKRVVEQHGGVLKIDSTPGKGTRVWISIPR